VLMAIVTSPWWFDAANLSQSTDGPRGRRLMVIAIISVAVVYAQLMIGAIMRHYNAGLAIPDLPWAYGKLIPPSNSTELNAANHWRIFTLKLDDAVTLGQIWLHFCHRIGAIVVSCTLLGLIGMTHAKFRGRKDLVRPASILGFLLIVQLTLGILTVYLRKPADVASSHVAVGALVLATTFFIAVRAMRLYSLSFRQPVFYAGDRSADRVAEATTAGVR
jgi:heme a synthase